MSEKTKTIVFVCFLFILYALISHWHYTNQINKAKKFNQDKIETLVDDIDSIVNYQNKLINDSKKNHYNFISKSEFNHSKLLENEEYINNNPVHDSIIEGMLSKYKQRTIR